MQLLFGGTLRIRNVVANITLICIDVTWWKWNAGVRWYRIPSSSCQLAIKSKDTTDTEKGGVAGDRRKVFCAAFVSPRVSFALLNHFASRSALFFNRFHCGAHAIFISWLLAAITQHQQQHHEHSSNSNNDNATHNAQLQTTIRPGSTRRHTQRQCVTINDNSVAWLALPFNPYCSYPRSPCFILDSLQGQLSLLLCTAASFVAFDVRIAFRKLVWENYFSAGNRPGPPHPPLVYTPAGNLSITLPSWTGWSAGQILGVTQISPLFAICRVF